MPELLVDIEAIGRNTEAVAALLRQHGLDLVGVTKGCLGEPRVGAAMLAGGAVALADTRDHNLRALRTALPDVELHRIHLPSCAEPFEPGDITYVSSWVGAEAVAALSPRIPRRVMVLVETGDEREGVPVEDLPELVTAIAADPVLEFVGLSTNFACFRGAPDGLMESVERLAAAAVQLRSAGTEVDRVSGGNSSLLRLLAQGGRIPPEVTEVRCGEALLLGVDALDHEVLPGCHPDACVLRVEVLEEYTKPARVGAARRLVLGMGWQDLGSGAVRFLEPELEEI
ncbi:MAG TPA: alanine racemase, partial [Thermoleophilia bacterium]|nr:alanine racemase [Thermoleophilia bacterium]